MAKILVFLSINNDFFPRFKSFLPQGNRYYFVMREGITGDHIRSLLSGQEHDFIPYSHDAYSGGKIRKEIKEMFDETWILCRASSASVLYFMNFAGAAFGKAKSLYLLDISGGKRIVGKNEIVPMYLKWGWRRFLDACYFAYTWIIFIVLAILPILFSPVFQVWGWARFKLLKKKPRICIAKKVISNQPYVLAKGLRELGYHVVTVDLVSHPYGYERCDFECILTNKNKYHRFFLLCVIYFYFLTLYDLFLFSINGETFLKSPFGIKWKISPAFMKMEFFLYKLLGKKFMIQVRDCTCYREDVDKKWRARCAFCLEKSAAIVCKDTEYKFSVELAVAHADKILFSTPDLKYHLPAGSEWLPNAIICEPPPLRNTDNRIRVIHSSTWTELKGTEVLQPIIDSLKTEFEIDFQILGGVPHHIAMESIKKADIALGQFRIGSYGNFDIECMMLAKPVIGYINPAFFETYPAGLPIVNVDVNRLEESIYENLKRLIVDEKARIELGRRSGEYVSRVHEYRTVSKKLSRIIDALFKI